MKVEIESLKFFINIIIIYMFELVPSAVRARASAALTFLGFLVTDFAPKKRKNSRGSFSFMDNN